MKSTPRTTSGSNLRAADVGCQVWGLDDELGLASGTGAGSAPVNPLAEVGAARNACCKLAPGRVHVEAALQGRGEVRLVVGHFWFLQPVPAAGETLEREKGQGRRNV